MDQVRKMQQTDYQKMFDLAQYAFQLDQTGAYQKRFEFLAQHSINYGSFAGEALASQVMVTPLTIQFFNQKHRMGGVGFVSSDPSYRGGGRIDAIMRKVLEDCREEGLLFSYLAPFSYPFYRRYGYELIFERASYRLASKDWPRVQSAKGTVLRKNWAHAKEEIANIYDLAMQQEEGCVVREDWWYENKFQLKAGFYFAVYYDALKNAQGYLVYKIQNGVFTIEEWQSLTADARRGIHRYIASHADSVREFVHEYGFKKETPFYLTETPLGQLTIRPEMMVKIVDVEAFLEIYPFDSLADSFALEIEEDTYGPWNTGTFEVQLATTGAVIVQKVETTRLPKIKTSIQHFTQLFLGYQTLENLRCNDFIEIDESIIEVLQAVLPKKTPILEDYF
ncbi:GNAT family N-acetyltransferase [Enterococcus sp. LJL98]